MKILVFVKAPQAGHVKTRLARAIGAQQAAQLYRRLSEHCVRCALAARLGQVVLFATPSVNDSFLTQLAQHHKLGLQLQSGADLGERMAGALAWGCADGEACLLIGSDCAMLTPDYLRSAAALLEQTDVALGPAQDGGYFLIGMRQAHAGAFDRIEWSSPRVLEQTRARLAAAGLDWRELAPVWDVDTPSDLERLGTLDAFRDWAGAVR